MDEKKVREAIERIRGMRNKYNAALGSLPESARRKSDYNNDVAAFETAIEALENKLPKKPIYHTAKFEPIYECPSCSYLDVYGQGHCDNCGQKIDWSE